MILFCSCIQQLVRKLLDVGTFQNVETVLGLHEYLSEDVVRTRMASQHSIIFLGKSYTAVLNHTLLVCENLVLLQIEYRASRTRSADRKSVV